MPIPLSAADVLSREFLELRAKVLELAASFDRLSRAEGSVGDDPRLTRLHEALQILIEQPIDSSASRAEQVQMLFSRPYEAGWQKTFELAGRPRGEK